MRKFHVYCTSNEIAQALRPHLIEVGLGDAAGWNDKAIRQPPYLEWEYLIVYSDKPPEIHCHPGGCPRLHTIPENADLREAAWIIKKLFDEQFTKEQQNEQ